MKKIALTLLIALSIYHSANSHMTDTLIFKGQLSSWINYNNTYESILIGGRYIPELSYQLDNANKNSIDFELSGNVFGSWYSKGELDGTLKPYRVWARYSTSQLEIRGGLQKISFGSATMLRPLMWFDQMDPRDPLQLTDGVWGLLGRYSFLNNANIWIWGLIANKDPKGFELVGTYKNQPEFGGRIQYPILLGEAGLSYHHRKWGFPEFQSNNLTKVSENRLGIDAKIDWVCGFWFEGSWVNSKRDIGLLTNQTLMNIGIDYTFGLGNGLLAVYEHLFASMDVNPFEFKNTTEFSLLSLSYPIGLFDNISAMAYYSWDMQEVFTFINWQRQYNKISLHLMAYWNPETFTLPLQNAQNSYFGGKGVQFMFVYNH